MNDLISRQALCEYALNQKNKSVTPNEIMRFPSAQPKKKLLFSDRQDIVKDYKKWCLINNVDGCEASFLAYLCIKGFIDG